MRAIVHLHFSHCPLEKTSILSRRGYPLPLFDRIQLFAVNVKLQASIRAQQNVGAARIVCIIRESSCGTTPAFGCGPSSHIGCFCPLAGHALCQKNVCERLECACPEDNAWFRLSSLDEAPSMPSVIVCGAWPACDKRSLESSDSSVNGTEVKASRVSHTVGAIGIRTLNDTKCFHRCGRSG